MIKLFRIDEAGETWATHVSWDAEKLSNWLLDNYMNEPDVYGEEYIYEVDGSEERMWLPITDDSSGILDMTALKRLTSEEISVKDFEGFDLNDVITIDGEECVFMSVGDILKILNDDESDNEDDEPYIFSTFGEM